MYKNVVRCRAAYQTAVSILAAELKFDGGIPFLEFEDFCQKDFVSALKAM